MPLDQVLSFGPYRLASPRGPLWQHTAVVPLPPKALAVLWALASQGRTRRAERGAARHRVGRYCGQ